MFAAIAITLAAYKHVRYFTASNNTSLTLVLEFSQVDRIGLTGSHNLGGCAAGYLCPRKVDVVQVVPRTGLKLVKHSWMPAVR